MKEDQRKEEIFAKKAKAEDDRKAEEKAKKATSTGEVPQPGAGSSPYLHLATNNLEAVLADEAGARCVHCLGTPAITPETDTIDESTIECPLCGVDAVVPASQVPDEATLNAWHNHGFSVE